MSQRLFIVPSCNDKNQTRRVVLKTRKQEEEPQADVDDTPSDVVDWTRLRFSERWALTLPLIREAQRDLETSTAESYGYKQDWWEEEEAVTLNHPYRQKQDPDLLRLSS